ncbi:MAG: 50S ribosomal protein L22 [Candidatus Omnitrophica bacterium]|nr:50S ribosomal protein L22 [Candidatus Omnitrophota bacterium]
MIARALEKYLKISPKKLRPIARLVNKKKADEALYILFNVNKKGALVLKGVIESAINNAKRLPEKNFTEENVYISKVIVNSGPALKRYRAMSMGRAGIIRKRTSHVLVELEALKKPVQETKKTKIKKTVKMGK